MMVGGYIKLKMKIQFIKFILSALYQTLLATNGYSSPIPANQDGNLIVDKAVDTGGHYQKMD